MGMFYFMEMALHSDNFMKCLSAGCLITVSMVMFARQHLIFYIGYHGDSFMKCLSVDYLKIVYIILVAI